MKVWSVLFLLLTSSWAFAGDHACCHLKITIKNDTPFTCYLVELKFKHGETQDTNHLPLMIASGMVTPSFDIHEWGSYGPNLALKYDCGEGRTVTLRSTQPLCRSSKGSTTGQVESAQGISATYDALDSSYWSRLPGKIHWVLN